MMTKSESKDTAHERLTHINRILLGIRNVNQLIVVEDDPRRLIERACVSLTETMGYHNAWIALLGGEAGHGLGLTNMGPVAAAAAAGFNGGFEALRERLERGDFPDCMTRAMASEDTLVVGDPVADCSDCLQHLEYGGRAGLVRRLNFDGMTFGILTASVPTDYANDPQEQDLFNEVAGDLAFALHKITTTGRLRESQEDLRRAQTLAFVGSWRFDINTGKVIASEEARRIYGMDEGEISIQQIQTVPLPQYRETLDASLKALVEEGVPYNVEFEIRRPLDGSIRFIHSIAEYDPEKQIVVGTFQDITGKKKAEQTLSRQLQFEQAVAETSKRLLSAQDAESVVPDALMPLLQTSGVSRVYIFENFEDPRDGLCMRQTFEVCAPGISPEINNPDLQHVAYSQGFERWRQVLAAGDPIRGHTTDFPDNEQKALEAQGIQSILVLPIKVEGKWWGFIGFDENRQLRDWRDLEVPLLGTAAEILGAYFTRKQVEEELKRKNTMLARTEALAHVGSWEWDAETDKVTWSNELFSIFGLEPAPEAPSFAEHQAFYVPEDRARLLQAVEECLKTGDPYNLEVRATRTDGKVRHCTVRGIAEHGAEGTIKNLYGSLHDITEVRRAEERIAILSHMLDDAPTAITIHGTDGRFLFVNAATASLHGYDSVDEFLQINLHELDLPQSEALMAERFQKITEMNGAHFEVEHYRKDGSTFPLDVLAKKIEWEGQPAVLSIATDITERKQAEKVLLENKRRIQSIFRSAPIGIGFLVNRILKEVNPELCKITGYAPEEMIDQSARMLYSGDEEFDFVGREKYRQIAKHGTGSVETRWQRKNGEIVDIMLSSTPLDMSDITKGVTFTALDITQRKQAEEKLKASEMRFKELLLNVTAVAVQGYALDGSVLYWNRASETLYGYTAEEALGQNLLDLIIPPGDQEDTKDAMRRMIETGETIPNSELKLMRKDGSFVSVYSSHAQVQVPGQEPELFCIDIDLTDLKQAEAEQETLQTQLTQAQKMESVGRLAGGVAHDFNNMLNVILGHTELALEDLGVDNPLRNELEQVRKAAERSANLTRQLLAFARKQTVAPKVLDLNETIASMLKMLERLIGEDIDLFWKPGSRLALVRIDPGQVDQMLANLAVNARDAIGQQNGKITIETANACFDQDYCATHVGFMPGDYVMFAVSDDGCGMDEETCAQIFEPFFTTKGVAEGTGLGLATIYGIVKQNEGFVNVYSEPGKGTTFRIYLKALDGEHHKDDDHRKAAAPPVGGNETILVVEDEPAILNLTRTMLERLGYAVLTAATPSEATRLAQEWSGKIDLLITDVVMPEMNGRDMARSLQECCPHIRSLFMSGYTANVIAHQGVLDKGVHFIQKPFSSLDLARKIREVLEP